MRQRPHPRIKACKLEPKRPGSFRRGPHGPALNLMAQHKFLPIKMVEIRHHPLPQKAAIGPAMGSYRSNSDIVPVVPLFLLPLFDGSDQSVNDIFLATKVMFPKGQN